MKHEEYQFPFKTTTDKYFIEALHPEDKRSYKIENSITFYIETKKRYKYGKIWYTTCVTNKLIDFSEIDIIQIISEKMDYFLEVFLANNPH